MSQDWIADTAKQIFNFIDDDDLSLVKWIENKIRFHAPPLPTWCERPTCMGWWFVENKGHCFQIHIGREEQLQSDIRGLPVSWNFYGPIPEKPAESRGCA